MVSANFLTLRNYAAGQMEKGEQLNRLGANRYRAPSSSDQPLPQPTLQTEKPAPQN